MDNLVTFKDLISRADAIAKFDGKGLAFARSILRALPAYEVTVRELEWERRPHTHETVVVEFAASPFGDYVAWGGGAWGLGWPNGSHNIPLPDRKTIEAAKAAAQADYAARIRSALTTEPNAL